MEVVGVAVEADGVSTAVEAVGIAVEADGEEVVLVRSLKNMTKNL